MFYIIVAYTLNSRTIGVNNQIPWHYPDDLKHFKNLTTGFPVIMGRKTYESLPESVRPLPYRENIVLTRKNTMIKGATVFNHYYQVVEYCISNYSNQPWWVIGGAEIYRLFLPVTQAIWATEIYQDYSGDKTFPKLNSKDWQKRIFFQSQDYQFCLYKRI